MINQQNDDFGLMSAAEDEQVHPYTNQHIQKSETPKRTIKKMKQRSE
jgi:hypothetical protein